MHGSCLLQEMPAAALNWKQGPTFWAVVAFMQRNNGITNKPLCIPQFFFNIYRLLWNHQVYIYIYIYIYCSEVEGSHDKESSINTPEGGFIHNMLCRSDGEVVAVLRCSPPCVPVLGGSSVLQAGQDPSQAGFWKESKRPHVNSPAHRSMSLSLSGSPTAYLAVGKRAPGVADPAVTSWCRWFVFVSRATLMSARDARHTPPPKCCPGPGGNIR